MKLLIVLSVIACSYGAKLDRTYLPPESAASAGGSPGSLSAPTGSGGFGSASGRGAGASGFQPLGPSGPSAFGQSTGPSAFGQTSGPATFGQSGASGFGSSGPAGQSGAGNYGQAASGFGQQSAGFNQGGSFNQGAQSDFAGQGFQQPQRAQASADQSAEILRYENQNDGETFSYAFETSNGISAEESGVATNGVQAQGGYSYTGDDGQNYRVTYTADENGYQPQGDHLPTPPPIPEEILRSIERNAAAAAAGTQEGAYNPLEDESVSGQQYSADGGYNSGPASFNQAQGGRPAQQRAFNQGGAYNQQSGSGPQAFNQQGGAFNQQGGSTGFPSSRPSAQSQGATGQFNQNQGPSGQFNQGAQGFAGQNRAQGRGSQAQGDNGYDYSRPQADAQFGSSAQGSSGQFNRPTSQGASFNRPTAPSGPSSFPRPSGPAGSTQGSLGPQAYNAPAAQSRPQSYNQGGAQAPGSAFPRPSGPSGSAGSRPQYNQAAQSGSLGPSATFPRPSGASQGSFGQGQQAGGRTQGSAEGYQYNRPGQQGSQGAQGRPQSSFGQSSQSTFGQGPQSSFGQGPQRQGAAQAPQRSQGSQGRGQTFEGPRQPASFSEQDGYKY